MHYLIETEHFLLREKKHKDICRLPETFPENGASNVLIVEFLATGAPAGEVMVKNLSSAPGKAEVLCRLCEGFQRESFRAEIANAVDAQYRTDS